VSELADLAARVQERAGAIALEAVDFRGEITLIAPPERIVDVLQAARAALGEPAVLTDLTAVDRHPAEPRFEVTYLLTGYAPPARLRIKARLAGERPEIATVTALWPGAEWLEREAYDLFGIRFAGHPNLTRILMPPDWEGHPLRKDFPLTEEPVQFVDHVPKVPSAIIPKSPPGR
jgi:NADH-quinone oxidoreductase subunit C